MDRAQGMTQKSHVIQQTSHKRFIEMGVNKDSLLTKSGGRREQTVKPPAL